MKFLVAVDGSPASRRAVDLAIKFTKQNEDASITLLNVQNQAALEFAEGAGLGLMTTAWLEDEEDRLAEEALRGAVAACHAAGVQYAVRVKKGAPAETIDRMAREENFDHIIMGTRGLGSIRGLLVGSVANQVLHLVHVPVTLVK
jgi:nucleotide-binding universal stress UspA family protein